MTALSLDGDGRTDSAPESPELRLLFHRLSNELGIILAHAELLEARAADEATRARAAQVVSSTLDAMKTARDLRQRLAAPLATHDPSLL